MARKHYELTDNTFPSAKKTLRPKAVRPADGALQLSALEHMQSLLMELRRNAHSRGFPMLSYLLDMSVTEIKEVRSTLEGKSAE